ncbi:hypothetical protein PInf_001216 [Phytophthora infestans]|nr:hypothetical protein PInf_001216 [Phytophthora infestans]
MEEAFCAEQSVHLHTSVAEGVTESVAEGVMPMAIDSDYSASRYAGMTQLRGDLDEAADGMDDEEGDHFVDLKYGQLEHAMSTQECSNALASEETPPIAGLSERLVVIRGKEMDPVLWSEASGEDSQQSSSEATEAPPTKKARLASDQVNVRASRTSIPTKKNAVSKKKTAHKKTKKAAIPQG